MGLAIQTSSLFHRVQTTKHNFLFSFLAGLLASFGFAPFHSPGLSILGIMILFSLLQAQTIKQALFIGFGFGLGFLGFTLSWVFVGVHLYGHFSTILSALFTLLFVLYLTLFLVLVTVTYVTLSSHCSLLMSCFLFSALWCVGEYLRTALLTPFPWAILGIGQVDSPLKYYLPILGVYGVSFMTCLASTFLSLALRAYKHRILWFIAFITLLLSSMMLQNKLWTSVDKNNSISVGIIQGNLSSEDKWDYTNYQKLLRYYEKHIKQLISSNQLVVTPETAIPVATFYLKDYLHDIDQSARRMGSAVLLGITVLNNKVKDRFYNSITTLGHARGTYLKHLLIPFGEFTPKPFQFLSHWFELPPSDLQAGEYDQPLIQVNKHPIANMLCYELAHPYLLRRQLPQAEWIVSMSDASWFGHSLVIYQHLQIAQALSLQTGRYQIIVNNNGLSSVINQQGEIIASLPSFTSATLESTIYPATGASPWVYWGNSPIIFLCTMIIVLRMLPKNILLMRWVKQRQS